MYVAGGPIIVSVYLKVLKPQPLQGESINQHFGFVIVRIISWATDHLSSQFVTLYSVILLYKEERITG